MNNEAQVHLNQNENLDKKSTKRHWNESSEMNDDFNDTIEIDTLNKNRDFSYLIIFIGLNIVFKTSRIDTSEGIRSIDATVDVNERINDPLSTSIVDTNVALDGSNNQEESRTYSFNLFYAF